MVRFFLGFFFGTILTVEALAIGGVGHGSYAPLILTASVAALIPFLNLFAGPLLWAFYFLLIPNLEGLLKRVIALLLVSLLHFGLGLWAALGDPAFARANSEHLLSFGISVLVTMGFLLFFTFRRRTSGH